MNLEQSDNKNIPREKRCKLSCLATINNNFLSLDYSSRNRNKKIHNVVSHKTE